MTWPARGLLILLVALAGMIFRPAPRAESIPGGFSKAEVNDPEVKRAAEFAVQTRETAMRKSGVKTSLKLLSIDSARQQVVAGLNFELALKVEIDGVKKDVTALVWWQAWNQQTPRQLMSWKEKP
jgi:hypothetical protein